MSVSGYTGTLGGLIAAVLTSAIALGCGAGDDARFAGLENDTLARHQAVQNAPSSADGSGASVSQASVSNADSAPTPSLTPAPASNATSEGAATAPGAPAAPAASVKSAARKASMLGYNMDFPGDWTNVPPFIDQMKNARAVQGECSPTDSDCDPIANLDLDANGWVKSLAYKGGNGAYAAVNTIFNTSKQRPDIGKTFVVTWEGTADVRVSGSSEVREAGDHRLTFVLQAGDAMLSLRSIDAADHARNIRVFRADYEQLLAQGEVFSPEMLTYLAPFGSLRFMDWMQSNAPGQCSGGTEPGRECYAVTRDDCGGGGVCVMPGHWQERPTSDQTSYQAAGQYLDNEHPELGTKVGGYPVETMVALANRTGVDPHFNMPADYDDDFVRGFASYVKENLGPGLRASVEYSNEVWNWGFPQAQYANTLGREMMPDEGTAWVQFAAGRTDNLCRIWKEVFRGEENRVRCLISPQTDWKELAQTVLECPAWRAAHPGSGPCYQHVDAISITGYFAGCLHTHPASVQSWLAEGADAALNQAFEQLEHGGLLDECTDSLDDTINGYTYFGNLAKPRGLDLYVYESGTHFAYDADDSTREFFVNMTRDQRMYEMYQKNFSSFEAAGGSVFNVWGWVAKDDAWANSESLLDVDHPKYRAILDFTFSATR